MNLQDYLLTDEEKEKLLSKLQQDIGFTDETETFETDYDTNYKNHLLEDQDETDLF